MDNMPKPLINVNASAADALASKFLQVVSTSRVTIGDVVSACVGVAVVFIARYCQTNEAKATEVERIRQWMMKELTGEISFKMSDGAKH